MTGQQTRVLTCSVTRAVAHLQVILRTWDSWAAAGWTHGGEGWEWSQGEGQAWGSAVSGASGTGAIAGSGGGEACGSQREAGVQGARRPEPTDVWVLLFSSVPTGKMGVVSPTGPHQRTKYPWIHRDEHRLNTMGKRRAGKMRKTRCGQNPQRPGGWDRASGWAPRNQPALRAERKAGRGRPS